MNTSICILMVLLLSVNPSTATILGVVYNFLASLFNPETYKNLIGGPSYSDPSIPSPIPILNAKLTSSVCGTQVSNCPATRYRSINGSCNNLANPGWGTPGNTYLRLLKNRYSDGIFKLPKSNTGEDLPNARDLSITLFKDKYVNDEVRNLNAMQWGQIITHDMSLFQEPSSQIGVAAVCCKNNKLTSEALTNEFCAPIIIPKNDPIHKPGSCLEFVRADTDRHMGCVPQDQEANQLTGVTTFLDASMTYGSTDEESATLRSFENGNLKTVTRHGREWPPQVQNVTETCTGAKSPNEPCYLGGDVRINQNTELTLLQVLTVHYHNYIADYLSELNPQWVDEKTFQEARRIVIAVFQNIAYYEYLPYFVGSKHMLENKLIYLRTAANMGKYINDYNSKLKPGVINEHASSAWRTLHEFIKGYLIKKRADRSNAGKLRLSDWFNRPLVLEQNDTYDELVFGITAQPSSVPPYATVEITEYLFREDNEYGSDLRAVDIQRNRDMGLGAYQAARAACNLTVPQTWDDLKGIILDDFISLLKEKYKDVSDLDLTVGGSLERQVPEAQVGPTFLCIILAQFYRTRVTDRFWFENGEDKNIAFTPDQLKTIRGTTMASFMCASTDAGTMQKKAFELIKPDNPVVSCDDIPSLNLNLWKDTTKLNDEEEIDGNEEEQKDTKSGDNE